MPGQQRNIVLIQTDEHVYSMLGIMGDPVVRTPNIDALARGGATVFDNSYTCNGVCVPSRVCLMTGRYPTAHGVVENEVNLPPDEDTMGHVFERGGYDTGYFGKTHFGRDANDMAAEGWRTSFTRGQYNEYLRDRGIDARYPEPRVANSNLEYWQVGRSAIPNEHYFENVISDRAVEFVRQKRDEPFLCYVSCVAPHGPFTPPAPYDTMYDPAEVRLMPRHEGDLAGRPPAMVKWVEQNRKYVTEEELRIYQAISCGLITLVDDNVGRIVAALKDAGLYENTLVLFTTDHGDFGTRYGIFGKSWCTIEQIIRTPLIVSVPGCRENMDRADALVENVDILPTLMDFAGIDRSRKVQGASLMPILTGQQNTVKDAVFAHGLFENGGWMMGQSMVRSGDWKLVQSSGFGGELYNLKDDPWELRSRVDDPEAQSVLADLRARLLDWHVSNTGGWFDVANARFWEEETCFYDETAFCGERIRRKSDRMV